MVFQFISSFRSHTCVVFFDPVSHYSEKAFVSAATDFIPPPFVCGVNAKQQDESSGSSSSIFSNPDKSENTRRKKNRRKKSTNEPGVDTSTNDVNHHQHSPHHDVHESRFLFTGEEDDEDDHDESDNHHDHHHFDLSSSNMAQETMANLQRDLRLSQLRVGKKRQRVLQSATTTARYSYWVDIYIEIDIQLCITNGETTIGPNTLNYINALFVGANTIFETEIDTHIHVLHVELNTNYDTSTDTLTALNRMTTRFGREGWHYTSSTGIKPDLHHALLSR
jgi:hypothetical protein